MTMTRRKGGSGAVSACARATEEHSLHSDVEFATAGKTNLTDEQVVDLLRSAFPKIYMQRNRKFLIQCVAKITPLRCRRADAIDEPTPVTIKRRKVDETRNASRQADVSSSAVSASLSGKEDSSDSHGREADQPGSDEHGVDRGETNANGDGESRDANGTNGFISWDLGGRDEKDDGKREMNVNKDDGRKDISRTRVASGNNRPMLKDIWGMRTILEELRKEVIVPLQQLKLLRHLGVEPTARIMLHGPPGCGKTTLARAIANEAGVPLYEISASALVTAVSGAPEEKIRELFSTAYMRSPSIVLIDEIDAMTSKTECLQKETKPCMVNQLITRMYEQYRLNIPVDHDAGSGNANCIPGYVLVIGATNRPDALNPAIRQWFDRVIVIDAPDVFERCNMLRVLLHNLKVEVGFNHMTIAGCTPGFVGGDLVALVKKAGILAVNRIVGMRSNELPNVQKAGVQCEDYCKQPFFDGEMENLSLTMEDFVEASKLVPPSSKLGGFSTTPNANWDDVGGLPILKWEFKRHIVNPIKFPEAYKDLGMKLATTFFLYGPSGCGKTLIVEALANEADANLLHVKVPQLSKYAAFGESMVNIIFNYARAHSPCIVFFDELDVLTPYNEDEGRWPDFRKLLKQYGDVKGDLSSVYIIGATNRREIVSHFPLIRTLFDKIMYVPRPSSEELGTILKALARNKPIDADVDFMTLGKDAACEKFNGADLSTLMKEATKAAIDHPRSFDGGQSSPWTIKDEHFKSALKKISPSVYRTSSRT